MNSTNQPNPFAGAVPPAGFAAPVAAAPAPKAASPFAAATAPSTAASATAMAHNATTKVAAAVNTAKANPDPNAGKGAANSSCGRSYQVCGYVAIVGGVLVGGAAIVAILMLTVPQVGTGVSNLHPTGTSALNFFQTHSTAVLIVSGAGAVGGLALVVIGGKCLHYYHFGFAKEQREVEALRQKANQLHLESQDAIQARWAANFITLTEKLQHHITLAEEANLELPAELDALQRELADLKNTLALDQAHISALEAANVPCQDAKNRTLGLERFIARSEPVLVRCAAQVARFAQADAATTEARRLQAIVNANPNAAAVLRAQQALQNAGDEIDRITSVRDTFAQERGNALAKLGQAEAELNRLKGIEGQFTDVTDHLRALEVALGAQATEANIQSLRRDLQTAQGQVAAFRADAPRILQIEQQLLAAQTEVQRLQGLLNAAPAPAALAQAQADVARLQALVNAAPAAGVLAQAQTDLQAARDAAARLQGQLNAAPTVAELQKAQGNVARLADAMAEATAQDREINRAGEAIRNSIDAHKAIVADLNTLQDEIDAETDPAKLKTLNDRKADLERKKLDQETIYKAQEAKKKAANEAYFAAMAIKPIV